MKKNSSFLHKIKQLRIKHNLTQEDLSEILNISSRQYQRIESGDSTINVTTLLDLSNIYQINLLDSYENYTNSFFQQYINLKLELFTILDRRDLRQLKNYVLKLQKNPLEYFDVQYGLSVEQLYFFAYGFINLFERKYIKSNELLLSALKITIPNFNINNMDTFIYNDIEIRLLLNISYSLFYIKCNYEYSTILLFLSKLDYPNIAQKLQINHSISMMYIYTKKYQKAIQLCNESIHQIEKNYLYNNIFRFYYILGVCNYRLNRNIYNNYFKKTLEILKIYNLNNLYDYYAKAIDYYNNL